MAPHPLPPIEPRVQALVDFYRRVERERMQGIPLLNPALAVEAVGFAWSGGDEDEDGQPVPLVAEGILVTPWFMSLVRLPAAVEPHRGRVGRSRVHAFGCERFDFLGAYDEAIGFYETCALFSPMAEFADQAFARETAQAALAQLRPAPAPPPAEPAPARRAFLLGRMRGAEGARP